MASVKYVVRRHYKDGQTLEAPAGASVEDVLAQFEDKAFITSHYGTHVKKVELLKVIEHTIAVASP